MKFQWVIFMPNTTEMHVLFFDLSGLPVKEELVSCAVIDCFLPYSSFWRVMLEHLVREGVIYPNQN